MRQSLEPAHMQGSDVQHRLHESSYTHKNAARQFKCLTTVKGNQPDKNGLTTREQPPVTCFQDCLTLLIQPNNAFAACGTDLSWLTQANLNDIVLMSPAGRISFAIATTRLASR